METQNSKFYHCKIYRISDIGYTKFYYGSTVQSLAVRMAEHRRKYKIHRTCQKGTSCTSYQLFEEYQLFEQRRKREGYHIQQHECVNKVIPGRTLQEYHQDYKDYISRRCKEYYQHNKEHLQQKARAHYAHNRADKIQQSSAYYNENRTDISQRRKVYRKQYASPIAEYLKTYHQLNRDALREKANVRYHRRKHEISEQRKQDMMTCSVCGSEYRKAEYARHQRSQKLQEALNNEPEPETQ